MKEEIIFMQGGAGRLETLVFYPKGDIRAFALLHHPHPLHGGSFTNKVVQTAARALRDMGFIVYLPNARGTGQSEGVHDFGNGESSDVIALWHAITARHGVIAHVLGGFSFGGYVALRAAVDIKPERLLLIAPAVGKYTPDAPYAVNGTQTLLIQGDMDDVILPEQVLAWALPQDLPVVMIPGAGHFFHGKLPPLSKTIKRFLPPTTLDTLK